MTTRSRNRLVAAFRRLVRILAIAAIGAGSLLLAGWALDVANMRSLLPGHGRGRGRRPRVRGRDLVERGRRSTGRTDGAGWRNGGWPPSTPRPACWPNRRARPKRFPNCSARSARAWAGRLGRCGGSTPATARSAAATSGTTPTSSATEFAESVAATRVRAGRRASRPRLVRRQAGVDSGRRPRPELPPGAGRGPRGTAHRRSPSRSPSAAKRSA